MKLIHVDTYIVKVCLCVAFVCVNLSSRADIQIGQSTGLTGNQAVNVKETNEGAMMYIDAVNKSGGVYGEKIEWIAMDDRSDPQLSIENTRELIDNRGVIAMALSRGTANIEAVLPLLNTNGVPMIGPTTGASQLHSPVHKYVFNVRSRYQDEATQLVRHQLSMGINRVAVVYVNDSFGKDALLGAMRGFELSRSKPVWVAAYDRSKPDFGSMKQSLVKNPPQVVLFIGSGQTVVDAVKVLREQSSATAMTLSNNASAGFVKLLDKHARGFIVSQVFPSEYNIGHEFVREAKQLATSRKMDTLSPSMLEGFATAKVLVEALKRASPQPTRAKLLRVLENFKNFDLGGGLIIQYSPKSHTGLSYTELSIVNEKLKFQR
jgi:branched-chain amino acid transport system substrate-binding protein